MDKLLQILHDIVHHLPVHPEKQNELHQAIDEAAAEQKPASAEAPAPEESKAES